MTPGQSEGKGASPAPTLPPLCPSPGNILLKFTRTFDSLWQSMTWQLAYNNYDRSRVYGLLSMVQVRGLGVCRRSTLSDVNPWSMI